MDRKKETFKLRGSLLLLLGILGSGVAPVSLAQENESDEEVATIEPVAPVRWALEGVAKAAALNSALPPLSQNLESQKMIMLTLSVDHQLFLPAYNDYDDIYPVSEEKREEERFPVPEITYTHEFPYVGYFDSSLCYGYSESKTEGVVTNGQFKAIGAANADGYCTDGESTEGGWSGNFLNWATMTRMDLVRFVLYGGYRRVDQGPSDTTSSKTILERSYLPQDAHSFAKYYNGDDIAKLTSGLPATCTESGGASCSGFTFCNTTRPEDAKADSYSQDPNVMQWPPVLRAVKGNYSLWASNERYQCLTSEEVPLESEYNDGQGKNGNDPAMTGIPAFSDSPSASQVKDLVVRVEVCDPSSGALREEFCQKYSEKSYKPVGLLQEQGESGEVHFGLLTGSYNANKSFGALRKNISSFADEVNDDGTFVYPSFHKLVVDGAVDADFPLQNSIVGNLNALRIVDYKFRAGTSDVDYQFWQGVYRDIYRAPGRRWGDREAMGYVAYTEEEEKTGPGRCDWGWTSFINSHCRNWGNPFSELLAESYLYFSGQDKWATLEDDKGVLPGLTVAKWPASTSSSGGTADADLLCANMNVLGFNSSSVSYDDGGEAVLDDGGAYVSDAVRGFKNLSGVTTNDLFSRGNMSLDTLVDLIGSKELDSDKQYFVGRSGTANDGQCTAKDIDNLSAVSGTCPEAPNAKGTYWGAGLAHFAHTEGVSPAGKPKRTVSTYGVTLSGALPNISVPLPSSGFSKEIKIIPACRNRGNGGESRGNCSLISFRPLTVFSAAGEESYSGKYYVGWEDSEQGGDFDLDLSGTIGFTVKGSELTVTTQIISESAVDHMEFGFIISGTGTDRDGAHFPSRVTADIARGVDADTRSDSCVSPYCSSSSTSTQIQNTTFTFSGDGGSAEFLETPLYYAAKWGSFDKTNGDTPDAGNWDGSGYTEVTDPSRLKANLRRVLDNIIDKPIAGTGAAVATTALTGEGLILSTLFLPQAGDGMEKVNWVGRLNGLFRADGENWEDSAKPFGVRTDADNVVRFYLKNSKTVFDRYQATRNTVDGSLILGEAKQIAVDYSELKPVWNARDQLAALPQETITQNRAYGTSAANGRYIFTSINKTNAVREDGASYTTSDDAIDFIGDYFDGAVPGNVGLGRNNFRLVDAGTATHAENVVAFIRGKEGIEGFRNRTVTVAGAEKPWLLGDIIHSTPALVGRPNKLYDSSRINDLSYSKFRSDYADRRLVTYVGANDGMLHAFNGGFASVHSEKVVDGDSETVVNSLQYALEPKERDVVAHPLGAELWAYVPYNLLPQLKWLTDPNYRHVYYVDSNVNEFDVNIFPHSATHPEGWGTIIVVGMRFGGSEVTMDVDGNAGNATRTTRSAYVIFDVTNPEVAPVLLGEITHPDLGHTLGDIDVLSFRDPHADGSFIISDGNALDKNQWYLVFGSGPQNISDASSSKTAKLFSLDLNKLAKKEVDIKAHELQSATKSYVGGITAVDWDDDFDHDMIYFGTVGTGSAEGDPKGSLMQAALTYSNSGLAITPSKLLNNVDLPFSREPLAIKESSHGGYWVFASSGKFLVGSHLDNIDDNKAFGIRVNRPAPKAGEKPWVTEPVAKGLKDITGYSVTTAFDFDDDGEFFRTFTVVDADGNESSPGEVAEEVRNPDKWSGWMRSFTPGAELSDTRPFYSGSTLGISTFLPSVAGCSPTGRSRTYILNMFSGLPQTEANAFVLLNSEGAGKLTGANEEEGGDVGAFIESNSKTNDASNGDDPTVSKSDGSFESPLPEEKPGKPVRRSWREVPLDELDL